MATSTPSQNPSGSSSGGGGGNRNRNSNRNRSRNRSSRSGEGERSSSSRRSNSSPRSDGGGGGSRYTKEKVPRRAPKVSLWQKILGAVGLGGDAAKPKSRAAAPSPLARVGSTRVPSLEESPAPRAGGSRPRRSERSESSESEGDGKRAPRAPRTPRPTNERRTPELVEVSCERLYVGNLSYDAGEQELEELFGGVGNVRLAEVVSHKNTQRSKGYAFIEMGSIDEARRAVDELHDKDFMGRKLVVSGAKSVGRQSNGDDSDEN